MPKDDFLFQMEEHLTRRIEDCIKSENFIQIPISMIYRIIEKSDKEKVSSDWLLDFILGSIDKLCVLFPLVDFFNLSKEKFLKFKNFFESDDSKKRYLQYIPFDFKYIELMRKFDDSYDALNEENRNLHIQLYQKEKENKNLRNQLNQDEEGRQALIKKDEETPNLLEDEDLQAEVSKLTLNNLNLQQQIEELKQERKAFENELSLKEQEIQNLKKQIDQLNKENDLLKIKQKQSS